MKYIPYKDLMNVLENHQNLDFTELPEDVDVENILLNHGFIKIKNYSNGNMELTEKGYNSSMEDIADVLSKYNIELV